ncbi:MAG: glycoside hydrolase family 3 protein [Phycisphaerales bacterium]|nr:glycoside hydrolase family 3 protein [Phycisphaerales bacterium]
MSLPELIGSSLILGIRGCTMNEETTREDVETLRAVHCKGVILFDHDIAGNHHRNVISPEQLVRFIADLRHELGEDLIVAIDQEGGHVDRLRASRGFMRTVSAAELATWTPGDLHEYASRQARQLRALGIDLNLAPCVDLAVEPDSPIIAGKGRSFGPDHDSVLRCASAFIEAHREQGVACCVKHFPGHGSSLIDTHNGVCDITRTHTREELRVFESLIASHGDSIAIMPGHMIHRDVDERLPASLSMAHLRGVLRQNMGFGGVIISDSLDMRAIRDHFGEGEGAFLALSAGCDLIIDGFNAPGYREPGGVQRIVNAISGAIGQGRFPDAERALLASRARVDRLLGRETTR